MSNELAALFDRDLHKLMAELRAFPDEPSLWRTPGNVPNSAGTLALHLTGNLSKFIGNDLGGVPFHRDREAEFSRRDVPRQALLDGLEQARLVVNQALQGLDAAQLDRPFPGQAPAHMAGATTRTFLQHLYGHLNWHLGQMNFLRRVLEVETPG